MKAKTGENKSQTCSANLVFICTMKKSKYKKGKKDVNSLMLPAEVVRASFDLHWLLITNSGVIPTASATTFARFKMVSYESPGT